MKFSASGAGGSGEIYFLFLLVHFYPKLVPVLIDRIFPAEGGWPLDLVNALLSRPVSQQASAMMTFMSPEFSEYFLNRIVEWLDQQKAFIFTTEKIHLFLYAQEGEISCISFLGSRRPERFMSWLSEGCLGSGERYFLAEYDPQLFKLYFETVSFKMPLTFP